MKWLCALISIAGALACAASAVNEDSRAFASSGAFFALSVSDIGASARWYEDKLGLKIIAKPARSGPADVVVLEGGGLIVELIQHDEAVARDELRPAIGDAVRLHGYFKAGLIVKDFDVTLAALRTRGVDIAYGPYPAREGQRANVIIRDNAGNLIQFFGPAPG